MEVNALELLLRYVALLVTIVGCEMTLAYVISRTAPECVISNDLVGEDGEISLNPVRYFDWLGTLVFPLMMLGFNSPILFGWSKSVFVNMQRVLDRYGLNLAIILASCGVFFHFFVAFLASLLISVIGDFQEVVKLLQDIVLFNVFFVVIKLCPFLPYDGLKILAFLGLKYGNDFFMRAYFALIPYGMLVLILIFVTPLQEMILYPASMLLQFLL